MNLLSIGVIIRFFVRCRVLMCSCLEGFVRFLLSVLWVCIRLW